MSSEEGHVGFVDLVEVRLEAGGSGLDAGQVLLTCRFTLIFMMTLQLM